jgi:hypothetical protein
MAFSKAMPTNCYEKAFLDTVKAVSADGLSKKALLSGVKPHSDVMSNSILGNCGFFSMT